MPPSCLLPLLAALALLACPGKRTPVLGPTPEAAALVRLTILSTNDLHGQLDPFIHFIDEQDRAITVGGAEALAATIATLREQNPAGTVLLDAGDFMQGSILSNRFEGRPVRELFALLGYDAVALGNHEFDFGPRGVPDPPPAPGVDPTGAIQAWARGAPFPLLSANLTAADGRPLSWPNVKRHTVINRQGIRIGVIGLTTPRTAVTTMPAFVRGLHFAPLLPTVQREALMLRRAGVEVVVLLAHLEGECPERRPESCREELFDSLLRGLAPGLVDAVVSGHRHLCLHHRFGAIPVVQAGSRGAHIGRLELTVDRRRRRVIPSLSRALPPVPICAAPSGPPTPAPQGTAVPVMDPPRSGARGQLVARVSELLAPYRQQIREEGARVLGHAARPLRHDRWGVSVLGAFLAQAMLQAVPDADFAVLNPGGVKGEIAAGAITYGQLYAAFPFDNRLATVRLSGAEVEALIALLLERAYGVVSVAGLRLRLRCGQPPRLRDLRDSRGFPLFEAHRLYTVVLSDFLLTGGDGLGPLMDKIPARNKKIFPHRLLREEVARIIRGIPHPLHSLEHPIFPPDEPPVLLEDAPCRHRSRHRHQRDYRAPSCDSGLRRCLTTPQPGRNPAG